MEQNKNCRDWNDTLIPARIIGRRENKRKRRRRRSSSVEEIDRFSHREYVHMHIRIPNKHLKDENEFRKYITI